MGDDMMMQFDSLLFDQAIRNFSDPMKSAVAAVLNADTSAASDTESSIEVKVDAGYGHAALTTGADTAAQKRIIGSLQRRFHRAYFLAEEKVAGYDAPLITDENLHEVRTRTLTFVVDPIDGTVQHRRRLDEWSRSVGVIVEGAHIGGVIYAPEFRGGLLVAGERGKGVALFERSVSPWEPAIVSPRLRAECLLYAGVDCAWLPAFNRFINKAARERNESFLVLCTKSVGSCALGLALVAAGRVDALIQPHQKPWDWCGGYPLVKEAGGAFRFYHYRDGTIASLDSPDLLSYSPSRPQTGFIAGQPELVHWLFELLLKEWG